MEYKLFGSTGLRVSELCLGTLTFGQAWGFGASRAETTRMFEAFVEAGGNFFDTANNYQGGAAEAALGELIAKDRDRAVIASKFTMSVSPGDPNGWGNHRKSLRRSLEGTLERLRTDYIDLYQVHLWDFTTPVEEVMSALDDLVRSGKVLHVAISNAPAWVVSQANTWAAAHGRTAFSALQAEYSLLARTVEHELVPMANQFELPLLAWSPLAFGVLSGKFHGAAGESQRAGMVEGYLGADADRVLPVVLEIARQIGATPAQVSLAWLIGRGPQVFPIVGARNVEQLRENLGALTVTLTDEQRARLNTVTAPKPIFPGKLWADRAATDGFTAGGTLSRIQRWKHSPLGE